MKTAIASAEETLRRLDVKVRLSAGLAHQRFRLPAARVVPLLAVLDSTGNRRRVVRLPPLLDPAFPKRSSVLRHWLASPGRQQGRGRLPAAQAEGRPMSDPVSSRRPATLPPWLGTQMGVPIQP